MGARRRCTELWPCKQEAQDYKPALRGRREVSRGKCSLFSAWDWRLNQPTHAVHESFLAQALLAQVGPISSGPSIKVSRAVQHPVCAATDVVCCASLSQYDRSGRSEGVAWVTYEQEAHAIKARDAFDGAPAKSTSMSPKSLDT